MENQKIRMEAKRAGVFLWEVAEHIGVSDCTFSKMMRRQLPEEKEKSILLAIRSIAKKE